MHQLGVKKFSVTKASPPLGSDYPYDYGVSREVLIKSLDDLIEAKTKFGFEVDILECYPLCLFPNDKKYSSFTAHRCTAGVITCSLGANGDVRPCAHSNMIYGNIFNEELKLIWGKMNDWRTGQYIPDTCKKCSSLKYCTGGCRMEALYQGDICKMDPFADSNSAKNLNELVLKKEIKLVSLEDRLCINKNLFSREESFGYTISIGPLATYFVTKDSGKLINLLKNRADFSISDITKEFQITIDDALLFFSKLVNEKIIVKK
ncbi:SPASM domain-containing protein [Candidatus Gracilibacteria bacterium]|nr:SPASM domain-containing protein [Candidatus Gracilibacteria bacterium]